MPVKGWHGGQETAAAHHGLQAATIVHTRRRFSYSSSGKVSVDDQSTIHLSGCNWVPPYCGLVIGASHTLPKQLSFRYLLKMESSLTIKAMKMPTPAAASVSPPVALRTKQATPHLPQTPRNPSLYSLRGPYSEVAKPRSGV